MRPGRFEKKTVSVSTPASGVLAGRLCTGLRQGKRWGDIFLARQPTGTLAGGESRFIAGQTLRIDGRVTI